MSSSHHTNTNSETDIPMCEGLEYPPQVFTNPKFMAKISTSENELDSIENRQNFIGEYCEKCYTQTHPVLNRCWCNNSDWSEDLDINNDGNPDLGLDHQDGLILEEKPFLKLTQIGPQVVLIYRSVPIVSYPQKSLTPCEKGKEKEFLYIIWT